MGRGQSWREMDQSVRRALRAYRFRKWRSRILNPVFWMALGVTIMVFTMLLLPAAAQDFIEEGQEKVLELKEETQGSNDSVDDEGRIALDSRCNDALQWKVRKAPDGVRYWSCKRDEEVTYFGASLAGSYGSTACGTGGTLTGWRVQLASGKQSEEAVPYSECQPGIDPKRAIQLVSDFITKFNEYDEAGLERITSADLFADVRTSMVIARNLDSKSILIDISVPSICFQQCNVEVVTKGSGGFGALLLGGNETTNNTFSVRLDNGELIVMGLE